MFCFVLFNSIQDLYQCFSVSKQWKSLATEQTFWHKLVSITFDHEVVNKISPTKTNWMKKFPKLHDELGVVKVYEDVKYSGAQAKLLIRIYGDEKSWKI